MSTKVAAAERGVTIKLRDLNLDRDGDGIISPQEQKLLGQLKEMDVDGDGEIGLAELCSLGQGLQRERKNNSSLVKILWGVILLSILLVIVPVTDLAKLTASALDGYSKLKFTMGATTYSYGITGYNLDETSASQRTVTFFTARGDLIVISLDAGVSSAKVKKASGASIDIAGATTVAGRKLLQRGGGGGGVGGMGTSTTGDTTEVEVATTSSCATPDGAEWIAAADTPEQGYFQLCEYDTASESMCCHTADIDGFAPSDCGVVDSTRCKVATVADTDLSDVLGDGVIAPAAGYVAIYSVDASGTLTYSKTELTVDDPVLCKPLRYNRLCVYGEEADEEADDSTPTPDPMATTTPEPTADSYIGSMEDCEAFVALFDTTGDFDAVTGNCTGASDQANMVSFTPRGLEMITSLTRYFCMECVSVEEYHNDCSDTSAVPYDVVVHIYTNSLPNHYMSSNVGQLEDSELPDAKEVYLPFKPELVEDLETGTNAVSSQEDLDAILCDHGWVGSNYMSSRNVNNVGLDTDCDGVMDGKYDGVQTWSGIGLDGVELASGLSSNDYDPHYPSADGATFDAGDVEDIDGSLGHFSGSNLYHYHIASTVWADLTLNTTNYAGIGCDEIAECANVTVATSPNYSGQNAIAYFMLYGTGSGGYMNPNNPQITDQQDDELGPVIGIALDGRPIRGPAIYHSDTAEWKQVTGLDICNGRLPSAAGSTREYSYYATHTHPYINGCFGPGPGYSTTVDMVQTCTTNGPSGYPTAETDVLTLI
eukprot:jgi/Tetstr1/440041/TSEL_028400.t1